MAPTSKPKNCLQTTQVLFNDPSLLEAEKRSLSVCLLKLNEELGKRDLLMREPEKMAEFLKTIDWINRKEVVRAVCTVMPPKTFGMDFKFYNLQPLFDRIINIVPGDLETVLERAQAEISSKEKIKGRTLSSSARATIIQAAAEKTYL